MDIRSLIGMLTANASLIGVAEAINEGRISGLKDIEDKIGAYQWSAILDERTCPICEELDGKYFEKGDPQLEELHPPIHIACRCMLVGVGKGELENFPVSYANNLPQYIFDFLTRPWGK